MAYYTIVLGRLNITWRLPKAHAFYLRNTAHKKRKLHLCLEDCMACSAPGALAPYCYKTAPRDSSDWANKPEFTLISASKDRNAVRNTLNYAGIDTEHIKCLSDEGASSLNIKYELNRVSHMPGPTTIYIQGHGLMLPDNRIEFLPHDYYTGNLPRRITCSDLRSALSPREKGFPSHRLIITDFCQGYNFNHLPYVLKFGPDETPYWGASDEWHDPGYERSLGDTIMHIAAGSRGEITYENNSGGIFTQAACQVIKEPQTLPELLTRVREGVNKRIHNHKYEFSQTPQLYSSHKLDLHDRDVLKAFGWFSNTGNHD